MRHPSGLQVGVEEVESEGHERHADREPIPFSGGGVAEADRVDESAVDVVEEVDGNEDYGSGIGGTITQWVDEECQPHGGRFHEEPCQGRRHSWTPPRSVVLAIGGLEETKGDECGWGYEVEGDERVVEQGSVPIHGLHIQQLPQRRKRALLLVPTFIIWKHFFLDN